MLLERGTPRLMRNICRQRRPQHHAKTLGLAPGRRLPPPWGRLGRRDSKSASEPSEPGKQPRPAPRQGRKSPREEVGIKKADKKYGGRSGDGRGGAGAHPEGVKDGDGQPSAEMEGTVSVASRTTEWPRGAPTATTPHSPAPTRPGTLPRPPRPSVRPPLEHSNVHSAPRLEEESVEGDVP